MSEPEIPHMSTVTIFCSSNFSVDNEPRSFRFKSGGNVVYFVTHLSVYFQVTADEIVDYLIKFA